MPEIDDRIARRLMPGLMLAASISMLTVGMPRFLHELSLVPATPIFYRLGTGETVTPDDLDTLERSRLEALEFAELPDAFASLGASYIERAKMAATEEDRKKYAEMAIDVSMKALKLAPLSANTWLRVTSANMLLGPDHFGEALDSWRASIEVAPFEPFLMITRVHFGIALYNHMSEEDIALLGSQFDLAYETYKTDLWQYSRKNNLREWMIFLSNGDPEKIALFSRE